ncbi:hypothetical protein QP794_01090 [Paenibacillus sp. UMB7766-LJ446]|uniref:hypothetical protein n=1 Tax=Paenibacillus sp. UMB7766-LJ446 TaxID=3046313 RepID=UPI0023D8CA0F|nr:hypothetical protein [Paenibacillus sp. UMB7766-LJ446]MDK8188675.1 hypothetical protein [Paenibacillus sp. UMB7766-LJ446]
MQLVKETDPTQRMKRLSIVSLKMVKESTLPYPSNVIRKPQDAYDIARRFIGDEDREHCILICLDTKNKVNAIQRRLGLAPLTPL